ncbi:MAG: hypothetical protein HC906_13375 [Bacteroidales bacterium]|nr:hypothetical protein [Bacteroidales bacterium]
MNSGRGLGRGRRGKKSGSKRNLNTGGFIYRLFHPEQGHLSKEREIQLLRNAQLSIEKRLKDIEKSEE